MVEILILAVLIALVVGVVHFGLIFWAIVLNHLEYRYACKHSWDTTRWPLFDYAKGEFLGKPSLSCIYQIGRREPYIIRK